MIKYFDCAAVLAEIPYEISLALNVTNCPHGCKNCHSAYLRQDIGIPITEEQLDKLIAKYSYVSCILFMGGDANHEDIRRLALHIRNKYNVKTAMYSGDEVPDPSLIPVLDYYKVGPYIEDLGPLNKKTTNQRFYKIENGKLLDLTYLFWKNS